MSISVHADTEKSVKDYAKARSIEAPEALDRLVKTALQRLAALSKYAKKNAGEKKTPTKKVAKAAAKAAKAPAKKVAKSKPAAQASA